MPLQRGSSKETFSRNVSEMMHSGHPQNQALAAAYRMQRGHASGGLVRGYDDGGAVQAVLNALSAGVANGGGGMGGTNPMAPSNPQATAATNAPLNTSPTGSIASPASAGVPQQPTAQGVAPTPAAAPVGAAPTAQAQVMSKQLMNSGGVAHRADGGFSMAQSPHLTPSWQTRAEARGLMHGPILSAVPGRTDNHYTKVASGSYVLPASHISSMGQGNSMAGLAIAHKMFNSAPYGMAMPKMGHGSGAPKPPKPAKLYSGGYSEGGARGHGDRHPVDVALSGGEFVIRPEVVRRIGKGSLKNGHSILDHWVMELRKKEIKTQKSLPPPAKD